MRNIAIIGSTGSIGTQTLDIVREHDDLNVCAMAAGSNIKLFEKQVREFSPAIACLWDEEKAKELKQNLNGKKLTRLQDFIYGELKNLMSFLGQSLIMVNFIKEILL